MLCFTYWCLLLPVSDTIKEIVVIPLSMRSLMKAQDGKGPGREVSEGLGTPYRHDPSSGDLVAGSTLQGLLAPIRPLRLTEMKVCPYNRFLVHPMEADPLFTLL